MPTADLTRRMRMAAADIAERHSYTQAEGTARAAECRMRAADNARVAECHMRAADSAEDRRPVFDMAVRRTTFRKN